MTSAVAVLCDPLSPEDTAIRLQAALGKGQWVRLLGRDPSADRGSVPPEAVQWPEAVGWPEGPGLVLSSGGSTGGRSFCLHPVGNLERSAQATAHWLRCISIDPTTALVWNPLPFHHVSGLMPWWRACQWGAAHVWLAPALMKHPARLLERSVQHPAWRQQPMLLSLVPTQLRRLLVHPRGRRWLQAMDVIWVGGASLPEDLAAASRQAGLKLAPCYGATETAAMVTAQRPRDFLTGSTSCGQPLEDVDLQVGADGALAVRCDRLALARVDHSGELHPLSDSQGWWWSGDRARLSETAVQPHLHVLGRRDGAILSGGVTVYPPQLEERLMAAARSASLPLGAVLLLAVSDREWGERLVALVRWSGADGDSEVAARCLGGLRALVSDWMPAERPIAWHECDELEPTAAGKWERARWQVWLRSLEAGQIRPCDDYALRHRDQ